MHVGQEEDAMSDDGSDRSSAVRLAATGGRRGAVLAGGLGAAVLAGVVPAALRVRRMRREAKALPPLVLDLELDGTEPLRTVVVLGDSSSAGFRLSSPEQSAARRVARALHLRDGRATRLRSVARNGATTVDVLDEQVEVVAGADVVLIGVGANDAVDRLDSATIAEALTALVGRVRELASTDVRIVLIGCPELTVAPGLPRAARVLLHRHVRRVAKLQARLAAELGIGLVPVPRADLPPEVFADDGFHPGPLGHERVAARVLAHL
jgi:lysophospholipase L1-like esterase